MKNVPKSVPFVLVKNWLRVALGSRLICEASKARLRAIEKRVERYQYPIPTQMAFLRKAYRKVKANERAF